MAFIAFYLLENTLLGFLLIKFRFQIVPNILKEYCNITMQVLTIGLYIKIPRN